MVIRNRQRASLRTLSRVASRVAAILAVLAAPSCSSPPDTSPGVSRELALHRARTISNVRYGLSFDIPEDPREPITAVESIHFALSDASQTLVLDFTVPPEHVRQVYAGNDSVAFTHENGHLLIEARHFQVGENLIQVEFTAGDGALNRNPEFLYTLFVPDRASSAFPCFDQPDIKATYALTLYIPERWTAVANGAVALDEALGGRRTMIFEETRPLSTYLFAFAAGEFQVETAVRAGRTMRLYHRETDTTRVARNLEAIFDLHETALSWLEEYTGIPYPFDKFDFVAVPSFQYGGMEHAGAILYRARSLFLDRAATKNQELGRASVIAHETAHMWFGDLVTMEWFNDVWMKEVFANFMAAKIVNPSFPEINHDLRFFLAHHPAAYAIDRSEGANPIRQELENLREAGSLYGAIIYQKAPIVMRQLERMIGEEAMREGLRDYLLTHQFANATWHDLIAILDDRSERDLVAWSRAWVEEPGRPTVELEIEAPQGEISSVTITQSDPGGRSRNWTQRVDLVLVRSDTLLSLHAVLDGTSATVAGAAGFPRPDFALAGSGGLAYGRFVLDTMSRRSIMAHFADLDDPIHRSVAWISLWEDMLDGSLAARDLIDLAMRSLPTEPNELVLQRLLAHIRPAFWRFLDADERGEIASRLEAILWNGVVQSPEVSRKAAFFDTFVSVAVTQDGIARLSGIWREGRDVAGLPLVERHFTTLAAELAIREVSDWEVILETQLSRISNPERRTRFRFVMPALSADSTVRDSVFNSLRDPRNRTHEPWVLDAARYLNHPLRASSAKHYIYPSLQELEEIQETGDIFFPLRWLNATFDGHRSRAAAATIRRFLDERPGYPARLRGKVLQAADGLFRVAGLR